MEVVKESEICTIDLIMWKEIKQTLENIFLIRTRKEVENGKKEKRRA